MVVSNAGSPNAGDLNIQTRLTGLGFTVTMISDENATAGDAAGKALVYISATADSGILNNTMRNVTVPVMVCESNLFDDMGMTGGLAGIDYGSTGLDQDSIEIVDAGHPMAAGFSGTVQVYPFPNQIRWGNPNGNAAVVATTADGNNNGAVFGYAMGAPMFGLNAPERRVGFFVSTTTNADLNGNGWLLFDAAVTWAVGP